MTDFDKAMEEFNKKAAMIDILYQNILGLQAEVKAVKDLAGETRLLADSLKKETGLLLGKGCFVS